MIFASGAGAGEVLNNEGALTMTAYATSRAFLREDVDLHEAPHPEGPGRAAFSATIRAVKASY